MLHEFDPDFSFETNILEAGAYFDHEGKNPEALPIHMSTAHNVEDVAITEIGTPTGLLLHSLLNIQRAEKMLLPAHLVWLPFQQL